MSSPGKGEYLSLSKRYDLIPVSQVINADLDTPISVYKKVSPQGPAYLLESVEGGENLARHSFIGCDPFLLFSSRGETSFITAAGQQEALQGSPLENLARIISKYRVYPAPGLPRFSGGAVGYLSYDAVRFMERVNLPRCGAPDLPDCSFIFAGTVLIFDHVSRSLTIVINSRPGNCPDHAYDEAERRIAEVARAICGRLAAKDGAGKPSAGFGPVESNITAAEFKAGVARAKEYIKAGDVLQVVLSRRLSMPFHGDSFKVYRRLRSLNPSPYLYYLDFGDAKIIGSSPEMLVRLDGGTVETCPIAGTRPRGDGPEADQRLAKDLLEDAKERAEHLMLVDLGRNDLGKVSETGSVRVSRLMEVEKFSHVMHLVSHVTGRIAPGLNVFDALKACFPAGTVTGAPKVRAMEIISELEPEARGIYAGAIGYFGFSGNLDTAIAIRTVVIHNGCAYVQAGAGIVADSDPEMEYRETQNKAMALIKTLEEVGQCGADD
ncbi:Anthranilate synthase component 1 [Pelotomaculum schinkii]|uniref:Anthranilate synthase component 1 n=1 Tax=Pelotomaculum schinkii TaxID=78350 RepID=A0A4Y7R8N5_9FIRM|nr:MULTISPECIES: anthranilate synthase component I [Pelotomaculum]TEB05328.1 Anthranilate synthase component 1 [Pelotomaculum schinkii]TEB17345.1 Anthranilate synthase component 1 [Pelotomaculum sp. FP]